MVRWLQIVIVFTASAFVLTGCTNSSSQNFLGTQNTLAVSQKTEPYSIENNQGVVHYKDNGVYDSTGMGSDFHKVDLQDIDFEIDYPGNPIGY